MFDWFKNIEFAFPVAFALLAIIPLLIWFYIKKNNSISASLPVTTINTFIGSSFKTRFRHLLFVLRVLSLILLIIVIARPQTRNDEQLTEGNGIDIMLCMDISGSMANKDFSPSRIEAAKSTAAKFVLNRPVDQIGLVVFSGESFTKCPLTADKNMLLQQINSLQPGPLEFQFGTLIGEGLATAVNRLSDSKAKSRIIILITDGEEKGNNNRIINPYMAIELARAKLVKVYTIGMSKLSGPGSVDEKLLTTISEQTGGRYFRAKADDGLDKIYNEIDELEKTKIENISFKKIQDKFLPFLIGAFLLLLLEILLRYTIFKKFP